MIHPVTSYSHFADEEMVLEMKCDPPRLCLESKSLGSLVLIFLYDLLLDTFMRVIIFRVVIVIPVLQMRKQAQNSVTLDE